MLLHVSAEYPQAPFTEYTAQNHPYIPPVLTTVDVQSVLPQVVASVVNDATRRSHEHAGRMAYYNLLVDNNFGSTYFQHVIQHVTDLIILLMNRGTIRHPAQGVEEAVQHINGAMVSILFYEFPELKSKVAPQILNAAEQNASYFNQLLQEIHGMRQNTPGYGIPMPQYGHPGQGHVMHPGNGGHVVHQHPNMHMHPSHYPTHYPMGNGYPNNQMHHQQMHHGHAPLPVHQSNFAPAQHNTRYERTGSTFQSGPSLSAPAGNGGGVDRYARKDNERQTWTGRQYDTRQPAQAPTQQQPVIVKTEEKPTLIINEGSEMDRARHQITYFQGYTQDTASRAEKFAQSTNALTRTVLREDDNSSVYVDQDIFVETNVESAIICARGKQFERQGADKNLAVFRCFAAVSKPLACSEDISDYLRTLREVDSFVLLATRIKAIASALSVVRGDAQITGTGNEIDTDSVISFLSQIDRIFTETINDFLANKLQLDVNIDSFADDIPDLGDFLFKEHGPIYSDAYRRFEGEVLESMLESMDEDIITDINRRLITTEGLNYDFIPLNHSLTLIAMNDRELGYKLANKPAVIEKETAPVLYSLAQTIKTHSKQREFPTMIDLLVTADGVVYRLHRSYIKDTEYLISKY